MKRPKAIFFLLFFITLPIFSSAQMNERLWVSFGGPVTDGKYLMIIDALGNVVVPPFRVSELGNHRSGRLTALSLNGSNKLNLWYNSRDQVIRIVLDKKTLRSLKLVETNLTNPLGGDHSTLDVTNRKQKNFISFPTTTDEGMRVVAYPLNEFGQVIGDGWFLSPPLAKETCGSSGTDRCKGGTGANGRIAYWIEKSPSHLRRTDLFVRPLGPKGLPILEPVFIDRIISHTSQLSTIESAHATETLPGKKRFLVYSKAPIPGLSSLILQQIDAETGNKLGDPITLLKLAAITGNVKIDPKGRFVLFISNDVSIGLGLMYLALDATGHASGSPRLLTDLASDGIGLLREKLE